MVYLILAIITSSTFGVMLKIAENRGRDRIVVAFANYVFGGVLAGAYVLAFTEWEISRPTIYIGIIAGAAWVGGLLTIMLSIKEVGLAYSAAISRLAVIVPVVICILYWNESLSWIQYIGLAFVCVAIFALTTRAASRGDKFTFRGVALLAALFIANGFAKLVMKVFEKNCPEGELAAFMTILFFSAAIMTGIWIVAARRKITKGDLAYGAIAGVPNMLTGALLVLALVELADAGAVAFSVWDAGTVLVLTILSVSVWKEKLGRRGVIGIALAIIALLLINMGKH
ncbi:MAG: hypothetical protein ACYS8W_20970 [Planctomycetota bacterium]